MTFACYMELFMRIALSRDVPKCPLEISIDWYSILFSSFLFLWKDSERYRNPTQLPARIYIDYLLNWLVSQFENEILFPVTDGI